MVSGEDFPNKTNQRTFANNTFLMFSKSMCSFHGTELIHEVTRTDGFSMVSYLTVCESVGDVSTFSNMLKMANKKHTE